MKKKQNESQLENVNIKQFVTFYISGRLFGVDINYVKEINTENQFTPIFHAPREIKGYVNIRGQIYMILDLRLLLGFSKSEFLESSRIILFKPSVGESFGVLIDKIGDVVEVKETDIEESLQKLSDNISSDLGAKLEHITEGVCKLKNNLLVILNPTVFLPEVEKSVQKRTHI